MRVFLVPAAVWVAFAQPSQAPDLAREAIARELRDQRELAEFTFTYEQTQRHYTKDGKLSWQAVETGETYMSGKRNVNIRLTKDGKPLKSRELDRRRKQAIAQLTADAKDRSRANESDEERLKRKGAGSSFNDSSHMSGIDVLRYCKLAGPRKDGGKLALDFDDCNSPWPEEKHYPHYRGTVWIDARSLGIDSWKAWVKDGPAPGALIFHLETQVAQGGARVPAYIHMNLNAAPHLFPANRLEWTLRWTSPKRFSVEVDQKIEQPVR